MNQNTKSWQGYLREDGRKGVRNLVVVMYTVECAQHVAHAIAAGEEDVQVLGFPGCYDNQYAVRLMLALGRHPNVGAVLAVGLGCEYTRPDKIAEVVEASGRPADWFYIQSAGGTQKSIDKGKTLVREMRARIAHEVRRVPMTLADLTVGAECGGSDGTSGLAGNPVVGAFYDLLVDAGGRAIFEETVEMVGLKRVMVERAADASAKAQLEHAYDKVIKYCQEVRQYSVSPGNFAGGLSTIEEKSMGAFAKGGTRPIQGVIKVAQPPPRPGLWIMDTVPDEHFMGFGYTNPNDTEGIMDLISAGSQIVMFITGRGSVIGSAISPLIKVTGNTQTYERMQDDMDVNAGRVLSGEMTLAEAGQGLCDHVVRIAAGEKSKPEALGHREYFVMYKHQDTPPLTLGCRA
jgi:altronate hydrolase